MAETKKHKLRVKGLKIAHININSIRNKVHEVAEILYYDNIDTHAVT